jgi:hypothetical protein
MQEETPLLSSDGNVQDAEQEYSSNNEQSDIVYQNYN